ncbi:MAG: hypothetical protein Q7U96_01145, partial [Chloroflexota bacterium]|nr:hypothetical protein [Chloroflexota bacterium]
MRPPRLPFRHPGTRPSIDEIKGIVKAKQRQLSWQTPIRRGIAPERGRKTALLAPSSAGPNQAGSAYTAAITGGTTCSGSNVDESEAIIQTQHGSTAAFNQLVAAYQSLVYNTS